MKIWSIATVVLAALATAVPHDAVAKRLGAGKPAGMQRDMPARTAPTAPAAAPAKPAQATPQQQAATPAAPAATPPKRNWMGPLAGLAAGLGIAALLSHFGLGGAAADFMMTLLMVAGAGLLLMFLWRKFGPKANQGPALAGAAAGAGGGNWSQPTPARGEPQALARSTFEPATPAPVPAASPASLSPVTPTAAGAHAPAASAEPVTRAFVPAAFDSEAFTRTAKMIFIRLQAANDAADLDDLRRFTTPELFASLRLDLQDRSTPNQHTDVVKVDAEVLDVANEADRQIVSVRFHGEVVEEKGTAASAFNEVWHLVKAHDENASWAIAGIEQMN